ncbi:MAG: phosphoenolpyruvate--protein phosphotransferase, partial [Clostridia bacterium]|nr:phosphoenolpyruvate--protein phosphotransferase [Clostridia bacterium]
MIKGIGVSGGVGIGKILLVEEHSLEYTPTQVTDTEAETKRMHDAVEVFCKNTEEQAAALKVTAGEKEAEIMLGHLSIVNDPFLLGEVDKLIAGGQCAESAFESMCDMFIQIFSAADDDVTKQRAADVRDVKTGVLSILLGVTQVKLSEAPAGTVLCAKEL